MKKIALLATVAALTAVPMLSHAASAPAPFTVTVKFTPSCVVTSATGVIDFGTYTAFAGPITSTGVSVPVALSCSRGIGANATAAYGETGASGVLSPANLRYTLSDPTKSFGVGSPATGIAGGDIGTPDTITFKFSGTLLQQAGSGPSASPPIGGSEARTLIISF